MSKRWAFLLSLSLSGCAGAALPTGPDAPALVPSHAFSVASCSDAAPRWITRNFSTDRRSFTVTWEAQGPDYTYEMVAHHSRDGGDAGRYLGEYYTNRSEMTMGDTANGGRYYLQVRITHNPCGDVDGPWSEVLTVYVDGPDTTTAPPNANRFAMCLYCHPGGIPVRLEPPPVVVDPVPPPQEPTADPVL